MDDLPWTKHSSDSFTASDECYVAVGAGASCYSLNGNASSSASITTNGTTIYYDGDKTGNVSSGGGNGCGTSGLFKLSAGQTLSISSVGGGGGNGGFIYYANTKDVPLVINKLEELTWLRYNDELANVITFTATNRCYVIVFTGRGNYSVNGGTSSSSISTTGTKTTVYSGGETLSHTSYGNTYSKSFGIYELKAGQSIICSLSGGNFCDGTSIYYASLD